MVAACAELVTMVMAHHSKLKSLIAMKNMGLSPGKEEVPTVSVGGINVAM